MAGQVGHKVAQHGGNPILKAIGWMSLACGAAAAAMIVAAVAITCLMIFQRFVLNESTVWQTETVIYLMVGATMIGLPYVQRVRGHVNVDLLPILLPKPARKVLAVVTMAAGITVIGVMLWYGFEMWHVAWERGWTSDTVWGAKLWVPYLALPIGFGVLLIQLIADLYAMLVGIDKPFSLEDDA